MVEYKLKEGQLSLHLYYSTNDHKTHFVCDKKDKLYLQHRKNEPKKVIFFNTIREVDHHVQKEIKAGRI